MLRLFDLSQEPEKNNLLCHAVANFFFFFFFFFEEVISTLNILEKEPIYQQLLLKK